MRAKNNFQLVESDIKILEHTAKCRLITTNHLITLTGRYQQALNSRLKKLSDNGYLYRRKGDYPNQPFVYSIHREAVPILAERGIESPEVLKQRVRQNNFRQRLPEISDLFLKHYLEVADIYTVLYLACQNSQIELLRWEPENNRLRDKVTFTEKGKQDKAAIRPDAFFVLENPDQPEGSNRLYFLLELERGTNTRRQYSRKIKAITHWQQQGRHTKKLGANIFRVITIAPTQERAQGLAEISRKVLTDMQRAKDGKIFYFTARDNFTPTRPTQIFESIFMSARDYHTDQRYKLVY